MTAGAVGFEPTNAGSKVPCLATWPRPKRRHCSGYSSIGGGLKQHTVTPKMKKSLGNDLLSQGVAPQVPWALADLTAGFGMEPGVSPPL
jgi:hypothetical protein